MSGAVCPPGFDCQLSRHLLWTALAAACPAAASQTMKAVQLSAFYHRCHPLADLPAHAPRASLDTRHGRFKRCRPAHRLPARCVLEHGWPARQLARQAVLAALVLAPPCTGRPSTRRRRAGAPSAAARGPTARQRLRLEVARIQRKSQERRHSVIAVATARRPTCRVSLSSKSVIPFTALGET